MPKYQFKKQHIPVFFLVFFGIVVFATSVLNHYFFRTFTFDYGNYNFAFRDYAHFRISPMPTYPGNFLQDHYSFLLMFFVPAYWLLNWLTGTYTLILIQNVLILIAAWFTYKLVLLKSGNSLLGVGSLIYYFTLLGRYTTFSCDANLAVMSACFIPVFIYLFETKKYIPAAITFVLSLLSRENIPIWFVFIFTVLIINHWKDKKAVAYSAVGIVVSILYFVVLFKFLIPGIETKEKQFTLFNYAALGATPYEAVIFIIKHPVETFKLFFVNHLNDPAYNGVKAEFYWVYLVSGGFILFLRPKYIIWFIPIVAQKVLNDSPLRWGIATYYSIEVVTLLPLAVFLTLSELKKRWLEIGLAVIVCTATTATTIYKLNPQNCAVPDAFNPAKEKIYSNEFWTPKFNQRKVNKLLALVPPDASVSASEQLFAHLAQRPHISLFPTLNNADYAAFSVFDDYFMLSHQANETVRNTLLSSPEWELVGKEFPVFVLKKKAANPPVAGASEYKTEFSADSLLCHFENVDTLKKQILFDSGEKLDSALYLSSEKALSGTHSIKLTRDNPYTRAVRFENLNRVNYMEVSVWLWPGTEKPQIVATDRKKFYLTSNEGEAQTESGWRKIVLGFWVPKNIDASHLVVYLWNTSSEPVYFDNYQIVKKYLK